jgi:hypothetical protein
VGAPNSVGNNISERPVIQVGCSRETKELPQGGGLGVESVGQHRIPHSLEACLREAAISVPSTP